MARYSRKALAEMILSQTDSQLRKEAVKAVAKYLVDSGRSKEIDVLIRELGLQAQEQYDHTSASVTTIRQLSDYELNEIKHLVKEFTSSKSVEINEMIDPSLLGGIVINTPTSEADLSVKGRLKRLKI